MKKFQFELMNVPFYSSSAGRINKGGLKAQHGGTPVTDGERWCVGRKCETVLTSPGPRQGACKAIYQL